MANTPHETYGQDSMELYFADLSTRDELLSLCETYTPTVHLNEIPQLLEPNEVNVMASIHALRLACHDYPHAFPAQQYDYDYEQHAEDLIDERAVLFATGDGDQIYGGAILYTGNSMPGSNHTSTLDFLFRRRSIEEQIPKGLGKRMLASVLEYVEKQGDEYVHLNVARGNITARDLYQSVGFTPVQQGANLKNTGPDHLIPMQLYGTDAISKGRNILQAQL